MCSSTPKPDPAVPGMRGVTRRGRQVDEQVVPEGHGASRMQSAMAESMDRYEETYRTLAQERLSRDM